MALNTISDYLERIRYLRQMLQECERQNDELMDVIAELWAIFGLSQNREPSAIPALVRELKNRLDEVEKGDCHGISPGGTI